MGLDSPGWGVPGGGQGSALILPGGGGTLGRIAFFGGPLILSESGNLFFASAAPGKVGIGTSAPSRSLTIDGQNLDGVLTFLNGVADYLTALYRRNIELQHNAALIWKVGAGTNSWFIVKDGATNTLRIGRAVGEVVGTAPVYIALFDATNRFCLGTTTGVELFTLEGVQALRETAAPGATAAYGKLFAYDRAGHTALAHIDDTGVRRGPLGEFVGALRTNAANQTIADATDVAVTMGTSIFDTDAFGAGSTFTIPAGFPANSVWRIKGCVRIDTNVLAGQMRLRIMKNAALLAAQTAQIGAAQALNISAPVDVLNTATPGDTFTLEVRQNTGAAVDILGDGSISKAEFSIEYLGVRA